MTTTIKYFMIVVLLAVCALLSDATSTTTITGGPSNKAEMTTVYHQQDDGSQQHSYFHRTLQGSDEYEPFPNGTPVAWNFPNEGWWTGIITKYDADTGTYTVHWEDGSVDYFDDLKQIDQMVTYANDGLAGPNQGLGGGPGTDDGTTTTTTDDAETETDDSEETETPDSTGSSGTDAPAGNTTGTGSGGGGSGTGNTSATVAPGTTTTTYAVGTPVSVYEEGRWYDGFIIAYHNGYYTVHWPSENEFERVKAGAVIDQMVIDGQDDDDGNGNNGVEATTTAPATSTEPLWAIGTPVASFEENRWWMGHISRFSNNVYTVKWKNGEVDTYTDVDEVKQMVSDAETLANSSTTAPAKEATVTPTQDEKPYPKGTPVYMEFPDEGWFVGELIHYKKGKYTIEWSDGSRDVIARGPKMDEIVANAQYIPDDDSVILAGPQQQQSSAGGKSGGGMSAAGKAFLSVLISAVGAVGIALVVRSYGTRKRARRELTRSTMEEPNDGIVAYRDEPEDDVPRII